MSTTRDHQEPDRSHAAAAPVRTYLIRTMILVWSLVLFQSLAHAQGFRGDTRGCAADRPCFNGARQVRDKVIF